MGKRIVTIVDGTRTTSERVSGSARSGGATVTKSLAGLVKIRDGQHVLAGPGRDRALAGQGVGDRRLRHSRGARDVVAGGLAG